MKSVPFLILSLISLVSSTAFASNSCSLLKKQAFEYKGTTLLINGANENLQIKNDGFFSSHHNHHFMRTDLKVAYLDSSAPSSSKNSVSCYKDPYSCIEKFQMSYNLVTTLLNKAFQENAADQTIFALQCARERLTGFFNDIHNHVPRQTIEDSEKKYRINAPAMSPIGPGPAHGAVN